VCETPHSALPACHAVCSRKPRRRQVRAAKAALHVSNPPRGAPPLCREAQLAELEAALAAAAAEGRGGALYLSGLPGTGAPPCRAARTLLYATPIWRLGLSSAFPLTCVSSRGTAALRWHSRNIAGSVHERVFCVPRKHSFGSRCRQISRARGWQEALAALTRATRAAGKSLT